MTPPALRRAHRLIAELLMRTGVQARNRPCGVIYKRPGGVESTIAVTRYNRRGTVVRGVPLVSDVYRLHLDHFDIRRPWTNRLVRPAGPKLEVSFAEHELDAWIAWVPRWVADASVEAPVPMMGGSGRRLTDYEWSLAGDALYRAAANDNRGHGG